MPHYQASLLAGGEPAVDREAGFDRIALDDGAWIDVARGWFAGADTLLDAIVGAVEWKQGRRWMYERMVDDPRLSRWFPRDAPPPHPTLIQARVALEAHYGHALGGPGLNYYRDGQDSVAWHRDRELRELDDTIVAILTVGVQRPFLIRPLGCGKSRDLSPAAGELLVMGGATQQRWEHAVPKSSRCHGPRVSISWRWGPSWNADVSRARRDDRGRSRRVRPADEP